VLKTDRVHRRMEERMCVFRRKILYRRIGEREAVERRVFGREREKH